MDKIVTVPINEATRLQKVKKYLNNRSDYHEQLTQVVEHAANRFNTRYAYVSLVDKETVFFLAEHGSSMESIERQFGFCTYAISMVDTTEPPMRILDVEDALVYEQFKLNPLVQGAPNFRFYFGYTLQTEDGYSIGNFCVADTEPRKFTGEERFDFMVLGELVNQILLGRLTLK